MRLFRARVREVALRLVALLTLMVFVEPGCTSGLLGVSDQNTALRPPVLDPPAAPTGRAVSLKWGTLSNASSYEVHRSTVGSEDTPGQVAAPPWTDDTAPPGQVVSYWIVALNTRGDRSLPSNTVMVNVPIGEPTLDDLAVNAAEGTVTLTWSVVSGAVRYEIWRSDVDDPTPLTSTQTLDAQTGVEKQTATDSAPPGFRYEYYVRAIAPNGMSADSEHKRMADEVDTPITALQGGKQFTCALRRGVVYCWGFNGNGRLGDGTLLARGTPSSVSGLPKATALAVGSQHACALAEDRTVWCWGGSGKTGDADAGVNGLSLLSIFPSKPPEALRRLFPGSG
ncbi:MAG: RCC1 domain-containing protein, partial [Myxococcales bacterium]